MKEYPKVPRFDHPVVKDKWVSSDSVILEKYDGSNFRFALYDEYFENYCEIQDANFGDFILGSSSVYNTENNVHNFDKSLKFDSRLKYIKNKVNFEKMKKLQIEYQSPIIVFAENMVTHTLEYSDDVPQLIIFDIYVPSLDENKSVSEYDYEEEFTGFLDWDEIERISENILNMRSARRINKDIEYNNLSRSIIGKSEFSDSRAEGYVIRNDRLNRRIKIRTKEFMEMNKKIWGSNIDESDPEEKKIIYKYATNTRIKKETNKILKKKKCDKIDKNILEDITVSVVDDIWVEEWQEFCDKEFNPSNMYKYAAERVAGTLIRPNLFKIDDENIKNKASEWDEEVDIQTVVPKDPEEYILSMINEEDMKDISKKILDNTDREFGNWIIEELTHEVKSRLWYNMRDEIMKIDHNINGYKINQKLYDITVPYVKNN